MRVTEYANYQGLELLLRPEEPGGNWVLVLANVGHAELWSVRIDLEDVTGPGAFGLDDTHMSRNLDSEQVNVAHLSPGQAQVLRRDTRERVAGPKVRGTSVYVTFSPEAAAEARFGARVRLQETGDGR